MHGVFRPIGVLLFDPNVGSLDDVRVFSGICLHQCGELRGRVGDRLGAVGGKLCLQIVIHQGHVGRLQRGVSAGRAHGETDVGPRQRRIAELIVAASVAPELTTK